MRWTSVICGVLLSAAAVSAADAAGMNGFRAFKWGMAQEAFLEAEQKSVEGHMGPVPEVEAYQLKGEDLDVGGIKADAITYAFFKGKFTSVGIDFKGFDNFEKLKTFCRKELGEVTAASNMKLEYYVGYDSPKTGAMLLYQLSMPNSSYGRLYLYSKEYLK